MKIGVFSDIHANYIGFSRCLSLLESLCVDELFFLGDAVGYMPDANEVVMTLARKRVQCIKGNHEAMMLGMIAYSQEREDIYRLKDTYQTMERESIEYILGWPLFIEKKIGKRKALFLHGGLNNPLLQYIYPDSDLDEFNMAKYDVIFVGHTHYPFQRMIDNKLVVNVGSCGLPRDQGNLISFAIYDSQTNKCKIIRTYIDVEEVINKYRDMHDSVKKCLYRQSNKDIIGTLI